MELGMTKAPLLAKKVWLDMVKVKMKY